MALLLQKCLPPGQPGRSLRPVCLKKAKRGARSRPGFPSGGGGGGVAASARESRSRRPGLGPPGAEEEGTPRGVHHTAGIQGTPLRVSPSSPAHPGNGHPVVTSLPTGARVSLPRLSHPGARVPPGMAIGLRRPAPWLRGLERTPEAKAGRQPTSRVSPVATRAAEAAPPAGALLGQGAARGGRWGRGGVASAGALFPSNPGLRRPAPWLRGLERTPEAKAGRQPTSRVSPVATRAAEAAPPAGALLGQGAARGGRWGRGGVASAGALFPSNPGLRRPAPWLRGLERTPEAKAGRQPTSRVSPVATRAAEAAPPAGALLGQGAARGGRWGRGGVASAGALFPSNPGLRRPAPWLRGLERTPEAKAGRQPTSRVSPVATRAAEAAPPAGALLGQGAARGGRWGRGGVASAGALFPSNPGLRRPAPWLRGLERTPEAKAGRQPTSRVSPVATRAAEAAPPAGALLGQGAARGGRWGRGGVASAGALFPSNPGLRRPAPWLRGLERTPEAKAGRQPTSRVSPVATRAAEAAPPAGALLGQGAARGGRWGRGGVASAGALFPSNPGLRRPAPWLRGLERTPEAKAGRQPTSRVSPVATRAAEAAPPAGALLGQGAARGGRWGRGGVASAGALFPSNPGLRRPAPWLRGLERTPEAKAGRQPTSRVSPVATRAAEAAPPAGALLGQGAARGGRWGRGGVASAGALFPSNPAAASRREPLQAPNWLSRACPLALGGRAGQPRVRDLDSRRGCVQAGPFLFAARARLRACRWTVDKKV
ncbi:collagen alpha-1(I) chain-like [Artibeus jamaicensis]|uniref:collagen alpha-1(I) chain-like n=1 Tax=Artibeus jamaicensis TaxID=9417 RepID=UPI00235B1ECE|nr:collagen alpha-1(I) chain-like [Artibeus jamaicensis]